MKKYILLLLAFAATSIGYSQTIPSNSRLKITKNAEDSTATRIVVQSATDELNYIYKDSLKSQIGLGNVDNTSDLNKPISTATQTALNLKAPLTGGTGYIQNQNSSAQSANMWITGSGKFNNGFLLPSNIAGYYGNNNTGAGVNHYFNSGTDSFIVSNGANGASLFELNRTTKAGKVNGSFSTNGLLSVTPDGSQNSLIFLGAQAVMGANDEYSEFTISNPGYTSITSYDSNLDLSGYTGVNIASDGNINLTSGGSAVNIGGAEYSTVTIGYNYVNNLQVNGETTTYGLKYTKSIDKSYFNLNNLVVAGFYDGQFFANAPNLGWFYITVETHSSDTDWVKQTATSFGSGNAGNITYTRTREGGIWSSWKELIKNTDAVFANAVKINNGFSSPASETGYRLKFYDNGGVNNDSGIGLSGSAGLEKMWFNSWSGFSWNEGTKGEVMSLSDTGRLTVNNQVQINNVAESTTTTIDGDFIDTGIIISGNVNSSFVDVFDTLNIYEPPGGSDNVIQIYTNSDGLVIAGGAAISALSGSGTRTVVADSSGHLSTIPTDSRPYKVWSGLLTQSGTSNPTAIVLENTMGHTVTWTRVGTGAYKADADGTWVMDKTVMIPNNPNDSTGTSTSYLSSSSDIRLYTSTASAASDSILQKTFVEIRTYN